MAWTSPNATAATYPAQAEIFQTDWDILVAAFLGTGVLTGCAVSQRGAGANMSVDVAVGDVTSLFVRAGVSAVNVAVTAADTTNPRIDLVKVNSSGTVAVVAGTPAAYIDGVSTPTPAALTSGDIGLALVYVPANASTVATTMITDKRINVGSDGRAIYGDGSDGNVTIASGVTSLSRDMFYDTVTIQSGGFLVPNGFAIYCHTKCEVQSGGFIAQNGGDSTGATGGVAAGNAASRFSGIGQAGPNGGTGAGTGGTAGADSGNGGNGGTTGANTGGTGATSTGTPTNSFMRGGPSPFTGTYTGTAAGFTSTTTNYGSSGGSGGGDGVNAGGGGGAGGGGIVVIARQLVVAGSIVAKGGAGGNGVAGNASGGGGGGGGRIVLTYQSKLNTGTIAAAGGTHGTKLGTGNNGTDGAAGTIYEFVV